MSKKLDTWEKYSAEMARVAAVEAVLDWESYAHRRFHPEWEGYESTEEEERELVLLEDRLAARFIEAIREVLS